MKKTYSIFAYKPSSDDYCRGCHMASYSSNYINKTYINIDELIEILYDIIECNYRTGEDPYEECNIFESEDGVNWKLLDGNFLYGYSRTCNDLMPLTQLYNDYVAKKQREAQLKAQSEELKRQQDLQSAAHRKQQEEFELYQKLQQKYG